MFTGIIQHLGRIAAREAASGGARLTVAPESPFTDLEIGESIAVEGACLTAEPDSRPDALRFFLSNETLAKTTLGDLEAGATVNLERSLRAGDRLGGHFVMGHVDGVGKIERLDREGEGWLLEVAAPDAVARFIAAKGSVAVDGISLTPASVKGKNFTVAIIPHTYERTSLHVKTSGSRVNLEADVVARYVMRCLNPESGAVDMDLLRRAGFVD